MTNFQKISKYKIVNIFFICLILLVNYFVNSKLGICTTTDCLFRVKPVLYDPIISASPLLLVTLGVLLILPTHYFMRWLWYIASWAFPVLLYYISAESVYTSNIQSGPDFIAGIGMVFLTAISAVFIVGVFAYGQIKKYRHKTKI